MSRLLEWEGCLNVRDLGGVPLEGGGETRFGTLVRSDSVSRLSADGWRSLAAHGIERIVDLRWREELESDPPRDVEVDVVHVSLFGELDPDYSDDRDAYVAARDPAGYWGAFYARAFEEHRERFAAALAAIADADGPVVFHCLAGKDRTGLVAALLLRLAGAPIDAIAADYAITEENLWRGASGEPDEVRLFMHRSAPESMAGALRDLEQRYGSVASYLRGAGLDDDRLHRLRVRLAPA